MALDVTRRGFLRAVGGLSVVVFTGFDQPIPKTEDIKPGHYTIRFGARVLHGHITPELLHKTRQKLVEEMRLTLEPYSKHPLLWRLNPGMTETPPDFMDKDYRLVMSARFTVLEPGAEPVIGGDLPQRGAFASLDP